MSQQRNENTRVYSIEFNSGLFGFIGSILMMLLNALSYIIGRLIGYCILFAIGGVLTVALILKLGAPSVENVTHDKAVKEQQDKAQRNEAYEIQQYNI